MADYSPLYLPGHAITGTASATITGGQLLAVTGDGQVGPATDGATAVVGVAAFDAGPGAQITYYARGAVHETTTAGAVTAGDLVSAGADGTVDADGGSTPTFGVFLTSAASGEKALWMEC